MPAPAARPKKSAVVAAGSATASAPMAVRPRLPATLMPGTTAKAVPALTPSSPGSASGLRVAACISSPDPACRPIGPFSSLRARPARCALRRHALDFAGLDRARVVTSGDWKRGLASEETDAVKRRPDWLGEAAARATR
jgi:hypothetical protein